MYGQRRGSVGVWLAGAALILGAGAPAQGQEKRREILWGTPKKVYVDASKVTDDPTAEIYVWIDQRKAVVPDDKNFGFGGLSVAVMGAGICIPEGSYRGPVDNSEQKVSVVRVTAQADVFLSPTKTQGEKPIGKVQSGQRYLTEEGAGGTKQQAKQAQQAQQGQQTGSPTGQQSSPTGQQSSPTGQQSSPFGQSGQQSGQQNPLTQLLQQLLGGGQQGGGDSGSGAGSGSGTGATTFTPAEQAALASAMAQTGQAPGNEIYDTQGNLVGWDRDGDGQADLEDTNRDGVPDRYNGGSNRDASLDPSATPSGEAAADQTAATDPNDPASQGGAGGPFNARGGSGTKDQGEPPAEGQDQEGERGRGEESASEEEGSTPKKLETLRGRVVLIAHARPGEGATDAVQGGWGDEWAEPARPEAGQAPRRTPLAQQLTRVEAAIAGWRQAEAGVLVAEVGGKRAELQVAGAGKGAARPRPQPIDPSKHAVWLVVEDSWREGQSPVRLKVTLPEDELVELGDGAYVVVQGKKALLRADERLFAELDGKVEAFELRRVILSSPEPPAFSGAPAAVTEGAPAQDLGPPTFDPALQDQLPDDEELERLAQALGGQG